jgi:N-acetylglutamate synthase/N-acetylornithine aminotransferase
VAAEYSERELKRMMDAQECLIRFVLEGGGPGETRFWGCDLTEEYVHINASYRT